MYELKDQKSAMVYTRAASDYSQPQEKYEWLLRLMQVQGLGSQPQNSPPSFFGVRTSTTFITEDLCLFLSDWCNTRRWAVLDWLTSAQEKSSGSSGAIHSLQAAAWDSLVPPITAWLVLTQPPSLSTFALPLRSSPLCSSPSLSTFCSETTFAL